MDMALCMWNVSYLMVTWSYMYVIYIGNTLGQYCVMVRVNTGGGVSCTTHSTYKGPYPFQTGPMQKYYRILTSMDPMHVLLIVI